MLRDEEWKDNRADISPAFTTAKVSKIDNLLFFFIEIANFLIFIGPKTRLTYPTVKEMCKRLTEFIKSEIATKKPMMDTKEVNDKCKSL